MEEVIGRCGFRCSDCLAYRENVKSFEDRQRFRDCLQKYYGDNLTVEECFCNGCLADEAANPTCRDLDCKVRACVNSRGLTNCAYCNDYPCPKIEKKMIDPRVVEKRFGGPLPAEDYQSFVKPYEIRPTLGEIRRREGLR